MLRRVTDSGWIKIEELKTIPPGTLSTYKRTIRLSVVPADDEIKGIENEIMLESDYPGVNRPAVFKRQKEINFFACVAVKF